MTYTYGTLIDDQTIRTLAKLGNVIPAISLEGYETETDRRRDKGVYAKAVSTIRKLTDAGVVTGTIITYTRENFTTVTDPAFVDHLLDMGILFSWYFMFMPVGKDPILKLVPTPVQRHNVGDFINNYRKTHPLFLADFWNDGPAAGGCLAGGRVYMHILNDGRVEPCVFAHFGVDNIREKSLIEVANSDFFKSIRNAFPYNRQGNLKRPCMIIDNPEVLRNAVHTHVTVAEGHEHGEELIEDPIIRQWIDNYTADFSELTDPLWKRQINNPDDRWYCKNTAYKNLFTYNKRMPDQKKIPEEVLSK